MTTGTALYFDGTSSARHNVSVEAAPEGLRIAGTNGVLIAQWPYSDLRAQPAHRRILCMRRNQRRHLHRLRVMHDHPLHELDIRG